MTQNLKFADDKVTVELSLLDMMSTGQSLRSIARLPSTPHGTREIYNRVGGAMVDAAHKAMGRTPR